MAQVSEQQCTCQVCASRSARGELPLDGISISTAAHITAAEIPERRRVTKKPASFFTKEFPSLPLPQQETRNVLTTDLFEGVMVRILAAVRQETDAKLAAMEIKIKRLEAAMQEFRFEGPWQAGQKYTRGSVVSIPALGIYRALSDTDARPGSSDAWQLLLKAGRDGRDYMPPPPPAVRTVRSQRR